MNRFQNFVFFSNPNTTATLENTFFIYCLIEVAKYTSFQKRNNFLGRVKEQWEHSRKTIYLRGKGPTQHTCCRADHGEPLLSSKSSQFLHLAKKISKITRIYSLKSI